MTNNTQALRARRNRSDTAGSTACQDATDVRPESVKLDGDAGVQRASREASRTLLWHLRWTVPLHILLPLGLVWLIRHDPDRAVEAFWSVHAGFPIVLLVTARWWWSRKDELLAVLLGNHVVSFATLMFFPW